MKSFKNKLLGLGLVGMVAASCGDKAHEASVQLHDNTLDLVVGARHDTTQFTVVRDADSIRAGHYDKMLHNFDGENFFILDNDSTHRAVYYHTDDTHSYHPIIDAETTTAWGASAVYLKKLVF